MLLNHIAIIISSEKGIEFYNSLGFEIISREERKEQHDELIYMSDGITTLEIYKDKTHPKRVSNPEAYGLRHLCFEVNNIDEFASKFNVFVKEDKKGKFTFVNDPDGLPIEIRETKPINLVGK
ncbi:MAG: hypothetical protein MR270_03250 [Erysipelotrichaceae bacterium]|nr:hypothetical protein [Erysipelotrichaceae bacterium]